METKSVTFAVPSLTHSVSIEFMRSAMRTNWLLATEGWNVNYQDHCGCQFVANARNELAYEFLQMHPDCDDFFFLDDDIGWDAEAVLRILNRPEDIIAGIYPKRQDELEWPVMIAGHHGKLHYQDHLLRALRVPTGFMRIKRRVLEEMVKYAKTYKWLDIHGKTKEIPALFSVGLMDDGWFWTEDYIFCQNASTLGFEVWVDPDINFSHRGPKAWKGNFTSALPTFRKRAKEAYRQQKDIERQMSQAAEAVRSDAA